MTICIAALAGKGPTPFIVCIADKALTYGNQIQWDADCSKITTLDNNKSIIMMAGSDNPTNRLLRKLDPLTAEWRGDRIELMRILEEKFRKAFEEEQEIMVLRPQMMNRADYLAAISSGTINRYMEGLAKQMSEFIFDCALLICGYDNKNAPYIILLDHPGRALDCSNTGFAAIGSGMEKATSWLLFSEYAKSHGISHTLYDCLDAKIHSELAPGVGYEWEMKLVTPAGAVPLHDDAKPLLDRVWFKYNKSPFEKRKKDDPQPPPRDWADRLKILVAASIQGCDPSNVRSVADIATGVE